MLGKIVGKLIGKIIRLALQALCFTGLWLVIVFEIAWKEGNRFIKVQGSYEFYTSEFGKLVYQILLVICCVWAGYTFIKNIINLVGKRTGGKFDFWSLRTKLISTVKRKRMLWKMTPEQREYFQSEMERLVANSAELKNISREEVRQYMKEYEGYNDEKLNADLRKAASK